MTQISVDQAIEMALGHQRAGRHAEAETLYKQVLGVQPGNAEARYWLGILAATVGKTELGAQLVREAIAIRGPSAEWLYNLGVAIQMRGKVEEAIAVYRESLQLQTDFLPTLLNLGTLLSWQGHDDEAENLFRRAVAAAPDRGDGWTNLGNTLRRKHRLAEAALCHERAIALQPSLSTAYNNLGSVLKELGRTHEAVGMFRRATELTPGDARLWSNYLFSLFYDPAMDAGRIFQEHRGWGERAAQGGGSAITRNLEASPAGRALRVGYLSADFRDHSVSFFFEGLLAAHNRARVEIFCYADGMQRDVVSTRLKSIAPQWRDVGAMSDEQLAAMIQEDKIDLLVDLAGHTANNRILLFARRAAPVQVSYLGYLGTTGLRTMNYRLTDAIADPPGRTERFFTEQLVRLPQTFACYRPPAFAPPVTSSPFLRHGHVTFGSFNGLSKVHAATIATWGKILQGCPGSRLLMVAGGLEEPAMLDWIIEGFASAGIDADRLEFRGNLDFPQYLAAHERVDIVLDTFPVVGHTVTCHALWMGVPVVTRAGETYVSRLGASVLTALGLESLAADTEESYVAAAVALAHDPARLAALRSTMRARLRASPLMDDRTLARHVEDAFEQMWQTAAQRCDQKSGDARSTPQTLAVAVAHHQAHRLVEAEGLYRQVLQSDPQNADALHLLGVMAVQTGKYADGVTLIQRAVTLAPQSAAAHYNLGCAFQGAGALDQAKPCFERAIALLPGYVEAWNNLGDVHRDQRNYAEAERCFREALTRKSDFADAWTNLGTIFNRTARQEEALAAHRRALELRPDFAIAWNNLGHTLMDIGEVTEAIAAFHRAAAGSAPQQEIIQSNLLLTGFYDPTRTVEAHAAQHRRWATATMAKSSGFSPTPIPGSPSPNCPLRVGYVSPDFYDHSVSVFFEPLLGAHHPSAVETFCYANVTAPDAVTRRLRIVAHHWRDISSLSDEAAAQQIRADRLDILVDLAGHTAGNRIHLFTRRLAPVQVAYLGYLGTTGLPTIDFRLTDAIADPPGLTDAHHTETLYRLPTLACYRPPPDAPAITPPPSLAHGHITFGCTNMLYKVTPQVLHTWAALLRQVPTATLHIMTKGADSPPAKQRILTILSAEGVDPARITFQGKLPLQSYLAAHSGIDVLLDTFPINGHTVTCHALWMGVPVVTLAGASYPERLGASVLSALDLSTLIAGNESEYINIARRLANDLPRLTDLRMTLRHRMTDSPLMQSDRFATDMERAYRDMLTRVQSSPR